MKKLFLLILLCFFTCSFSVSVFADVNAQADKAPVSGTSKSSCECSNGTTGANCCENEKSVTTNNATGENASAGSSSGSGSSSSSGSSNTSTVIPNPLYGTSGLCDDLLACNKQGLGKFVQNLQPGIQNTYIYKFMIPQIIKLVLNISGGIAVLMLVYYGVQYFTVGVAGKEPGELGYSIFYTLIGLVIIALARAIVAIVENLPLG